MIKPIIIQSELSNAYKYINEIQKDQQQISSQITTTLLEIIQGLENIYKYMTAPKVIQYDESGNPIGTAAIMDEE